MSYYYNYYVGYELEGKLYPLGPYDSFGKLRCVLSRSRNYASDLYEDFGYVSEKLISDELRKQFSYKNYEGNEVMRDVRYLPFNELPYGSSIKTGYFLVEDVKRYETCEEYEFDGFYDWLTPTIYAAKLRNEMIAPPKKEVDEFGNDVTPHPATDYTFYAYQDKESREYEAEVIRLLADILAPYEGMHLLKGAKLVVLETEG